MLPELASENDYEEVLSGWGQFMYHEIVRAHATGSLARLKRLLLEEYGECCKECTQRTLQYL